MSVSANAEEISGGKRPVAGQHGRSHGLFSEAWHLARGRTLVLALAAACLAGAMAWRVDFFHAQLWFLCLVGLVLAQAAANLIHSKQDVATADAVSSQWGVDPVQGSLVSRTGYSLVLLIVSAAALGCGGWLVFMRGGATFDLMLAGVTLILFYTWPLRRYGLGEITAVLVWGPLAVHGTFYVVAGGWSPELVLVAFLFAIGPAATVLAEHVDRCERDSEMGIRTLPVMFGAAGACTLIKLMIALQYALLCTLFYNETFGWPLLFVLLCATRVPPLWSKLESVSLETPTEHFTPAVEAVFLHTRLFTAAYVIAVILDVIIVDLLT